MIGREHNREVVDKKKILEVQTGSKTITPKLDTKTDITFISKKKKKDRIFRCLYSCFTLIRKASVRYKKLYIIDLVGVK